jgi:serine protease Do
MEIAVLKIEAQDVPHFDLSQAVDLRPGERVLALSNLYGIAAGNEPASVMHGVVSAVAELAARRGAFQSPYQGLVYVLDAVTNNAGAAGGALTDWNGQLAGLLGKELRNTRDNTWLNYAIPVQAFVPSVQAIVQGESAPDTQQQQSAQQPVSLERLGIRLIPDLLARTPPFVDQVLSDSPAHQAGLRPDDLIVMVNQQTVRSRQQLSDELLRIEADRPLDLVVLRDQQLVDVRVSPAP